MFCLACSLFLFVCCFVFFSFLLFSWKRHPPVFRFSLSGKGVLSKSEQANSQVKKQGNGDYWHVRCTLVLLSRNIFQLWAQVAAISQPLDSHLPWCRRTKMIRANSLPLFSQETVHGHAEQLEVSTSIAQAALRVFYQVETPKRVDNTVWV